MKVLKQFIFMLVVIIGISATAMAQKNDDNQNRPPKKDPPQIPAPDKNNRPKDPPKNDNNGNRPKKPQDAIFVSGKEIEINFA